jgi:hypothetical protein
VQAEGATSEQAEVGAEGAASERVSAREAELELVASPSELVASPSELLAAPSEQRAVEAIVQEVRTTTSAAAAAANAARAGWFDITHFGAVGDGLHNDTVGTALAPGLGVGVRGGEGYAPPCSVV